jgi:hypothetical protein
MSQSLPVIKSCKANTPVIKNVCVKKKITIKCDVMVVRFVHLYLFKGKTKYVTANSLFAQNDNNSKMKYLAINDYNIKY